MRVVTHADCKTLLQSLDRKLAGVVIAAAAIRQSLDTQDPQRHEELMVELTRMDKAASVLRSRRDGLTRRRKDLQGSGG
jgi:hypothetical protein